MRRGLKVAVLAEGDQSYRLDGQPPITLSGPTLLVSLNEGDPLQERISLTDQTIRCALVQIESRFAEEAFGADLEMIDRRRRVGSPGLWVKTAPPHFRSLALQMAECRIGGSLRDLYLSAKALELVAIAVDEVASERKTAAHKLSARTIEQIEAAKELLIAAERDPPSLTELARMTGLNTTKLTSGFRIVFGKSVFAYLQEHRLREAYEALRSRKKTITEVAFDVGYSPAHFSSLFRKRFGIAPSALKFE